MILKHICEICGTREILDSEEAFLLGWDYPPVFSPFGVIFPRTCPNCPIDDSTLWWALEIGKKHLSDLTPNQIVTLTRILNEPNSILISDNDGLSD